MDCGVAELPAQDEQEAPAPRRFRTFLVKPGVPE